MSPHVMCTRTRTGIQIGLCHIRPAPREIGSEAERIQTGLLRRPTVISAQAPWWVRVCRSLLGEHS